MFGTSNRRATASDIAEIGRRMQSIERRLQSMARGRAQRVSTGMSDATDRVGDMVATALSDISDRFRGGARSVGDEATRFGQEAAKFGNNALRRLTDEVEHRPLMLLAVAVGVGFLVGMAGMAGRRH
jgi:hypothetical protein